MQENKLTYVRVHENKLLGEQLLVLVHNCYSLLLLLIIVYVVIVAAASDVEVSLDGEREREREREREKVRSNLRNKYTRTHI